jgi:hypothetical protein
MVGERWQVLSPDEKEPYESSANSAKERYNAELAVYKKTDGYREYVQYLADFKVKYSVQTSGIVTFRNTPILADVSPRTDSLALAFSNPSRSLRSCVPALSLPFISFAQAQRQCLTVHPSRKKTHQGRRSERRRCSRRYLCPRPKPPADHPDAGWS